MKDCFGSIHFIQKVQKKMKSRQQESSSSVVNSEDAWSSMCHIKPSLKIPSEAWSSSSTTTTTQPQSPAAPNHHRSPFWIIAHRGASYHLPEHSLPAYRLALELGADFIEPDLVVSSDGILFAMHTVDLNITTNVQEVFGSTVEPWYSPYAQRKGYWSFNFTWQQIQTLRIRQRLPDARSKAFDYLFPIPSLDDILETLYHWNWVDLPTVVPRVHAADENIHSTSNNNESNYNQSWLFKYRSGLYVEFKQSEWFQSDAGIDIVQLFYDQIRNAFSSTEQQKQQIYWQSLLSCNDTLDARRRFDEYIMPGLVLQSFNGSDLQRFHTMWKSNITATNEVDDTTTGQTSSLAQLAIEPPYVLLVDQNHCWDEAFWFQISDQWRSFLSAIGPEKTCLLGKNTVNNDKTSEQQSEEQEQHIAAFLEKTEKLGLVLHPWTERPEQIYVTGSSMEPTTKSSSSSSKDKQQLPYVFADNYEELLYLFCQVRGVHGIFTESVDTAVRAAMACQQQLLVVENSNKGHASQPKMKEDGQLCYESEQEANMYIGIAAFVMGCFISIFIVIGWNRCTTAHHSKRKMRSKATRVSTNSDDDDDDDDEYDNANYNRPGSDLELT
jgi:glycerophosphoryl diester phosphodiesterase